MHEHAPSCLCMLSLCMLCFCMHKHAPACSCMLLCDLLCSHIYLRAPACSCMLMHAHACSCVIFCDYMYFCMLMHAHACSCMLLHAHACSCVLHVPLLRTPAYSCVLLGASTTVYYRATQLEPATYLILWLSTLQFILPFLVNFLGRQKKNSPA